MTRTGATRTATLPARGRTTARTTARTIVHGERTPVAIRVLGALSVVGVDDLTRSSHRRLLAILLLDGGCRMSVESLIERFWGGAPPRTAKGSIHTHVSALRHALPPDVLATDRDGYRVDVERTTVDRDDFVALARRAHLQAGAAQWRDVVATTESAIGLWNGEPFAELSNDDFARPEITRLQELRLQALELRAEALLRLGRAREAIADLEWATRSYPLRESMSTLLALARQETGAHAEALRSLRATERALAELGLEPSPELRVLEHQILTHRRGLGIAPRDDDRRRSA